MCFVTSPLDRYITSASIKMSIRYDLETLHKYKPTQGEAFGVSFMITSLFFDEVIKI